MTSCDITLLNYSLINDHLVFRWFDRDAYLKIKDLYLLYHGTIWYTGLFLQYTSSYLRPVLQALAIAMASYDSWYQLPQNSGRVVKLLASAINGSDYVMFPNRRGMKFADLTQDCDVQFTKAFWSINEDPNIRVMCSCVALYISVWSCVLNFCM